MVWALAGDGSRDPIVITTADRVANGLVFMVVVVGFNNNGCGFEWWFSGWSPGGLAVPVAPRPVRDFAFVGESPLDGVAAAEM